MIATNTAIETYRKSICYLHFAITLIGRADPQKVRLDGAVPFHFLTASRRTIEGLDLRASPLTRIASASPLALATAVAASMTARSFSYLAVRTFWPATCLSSIAFSNTGVNSRSLIVTSRTAAISLDSSVTMASMDFLRSARFVTQSSAENWPIDRLIDSTNLEVITSSMTLPYWV